MQSKLSCGEEDLVVLQERLHEVEKEKKGVDRELEQARVGMEVVEESLDDIQDEDFEEELEEATSVKSTEDGVRNEERDDNGDDVKVDSEKN